MGPGLGLKTWHPWADLRDAAAFEPSERGTRGPWLEGWCRDRDSEERAEPILSPVVSVHPMVSAAVPLASDPGPHALRSAFPASSLVPAGAGR